MKISTQIPEVSKPAQLIGPIQPSPKSNISFKSLIDAIAAKQATLGFNFDAPLAQITKIREVLEKSKSVDSKDLLLYQIQISELNMRVELLSKAADSAVALARKLQNAQ